MKTTFFKSLLTLLIPFTVFATGCRDNREVGVPNYPSNNGGRGGNNQTTTVVTTGGPVIMTNAYDAVISSPTAKYSNCCGEVYEVSFVVRDNNGAIIKAGIASVNNADYNQLSFWIVVNHVDEVGGVIQLWSDGSATGIGFYVIQ